MIYDENDVIYIIERFIGDFTIYDIWCHFQFWHSLGYLRKILNSFEKEGVLTAYRLEHVSGRPKFYKFNKKLK